MATVVAILKINFSLLRPVELKLDKKHWGDLLIKNS